MVVAIVPRAPGASPPASRAARAPTTADEVGREPHEDLADRAGVAREDLGPQVGVAGGDPGDVTKTLPGQGDGLAVERLETGRHEARRELRHVGDRRHGPVVLLGREPAHRGTGRLGDVGDERHDLGQRLVGRCEHPGPTVEEVVPARDGPGPLSAGHRVRPAVPGEVDPVGPQPREHHALDRGDVRDRRRGETVQRRADAARRDVGRGGDDDEVRREHLPLPREPAGTEVAGQRRVRGDGVLERHVVAVTGQRQAEARADQARAHDVDPHQRPAALYSAATSVALSERHFPGLVSPSRIGPTSVRTSEVTG